MNEKFNEFEREQITESRFKDKSQLTKYKDLDVKTKEVIEIKVPDKNEKVVITITKRTFYDPVKNKIITDQTVHRAKYRLGSNKGKGIKN